MKDQSSPKSGSAHPTGKRPVAEPDPLTAELQAQIGRRLKDHYSSVLAEPIPDRFARLLEQLDTAAPAPRTDADEAEAG